MVTVDGWQRHSEDGWAIDLFDPPPQDRSPRSDGAAGESGLLFLPGQSGKTLARSEAWTRALASGGLRAACPVAGSGWWVESSERIAGRSPLTFLHELIVPFLRRRWATSEATSEATGLVLGLAGVSLGGQGVLRLAYRHARDYPVVAAIAPAVDFHHLHGLGMPLDDWFDGPEPARQQTVPLHLNPLSWPPHQLICCDSDDPDWYESAKRLKEKLASSGIPCTTRFVSHGLGHCWDYFDAVAGEVVEYLLEQLEAVRRSA